MSSTAHGGAPAHSAARKPTGKKTSVAVAHRTHGTAPETAHRLTVLRQMLLIRRFEERCVELYSGSRIRGFVHLYIGEEAVAVGVNQALGEEDAEMYGKATGCSHGRGGSMHLFDAARHFYGGNAIVAGGLPLAAGLALADRMRGSTRVTCCFFGDGAFAEGEFHETANLAALWELPLLLVCENNLYAMGTSLAREHAQTNLAMRAASYGMPAWTVDGMDVLAVEAAAQRAAESIRAGNGPPFLEAQTYRYRAHSMYVPDRYRVKSEIEQWKGRDPLSGLTDRMRAEGQLGDAALEELEQSVAEEVGAAVQSAEDAPIEPVADLLRFVTSPAEEAS